MWDMRDMRALSVLGEVLLLLSLTQSLDIVAWEDAHELALLALPPARLILL